MGANAEPALPATITNCESNIKRNRVFLDEIACILLIKRKERCGLISRFDGSETYSEWSLVALIFVE